MIYHLLWHLVKSLLQTCKHQVQYSFVLFLRNYSCTSLTTKMHQLSFNLQIKWTTACWYLLSLPNQTLKKFHHFGLTTSGICGFHVPQYHLYELLTITLLFQSSASFFSWKLNLWVLSNGTTPSHVTPPQLPYFKDFCQTYSNVLHKNMHVIQYSHSATSYPIIPMALDTPDSTRSPAQRDGFWSDFKQRHCFWV